MVAGHGNACGTATSVRPLVAVGREVDRLFEQFFGKPANRAGSVQPTWWAPANLLEDEKSFYVELDMPGVKHEDLEVVVEKQTLKISAERKAPEDSRQLLHQERGFGRIERTVTLPENVNAESVEATLADGVLRVQLAKREENQPKKINVKTN